MLFLTALLAVVTTPTHALSPWSTRELEELEKEFIQQINQSDSIIRNPLASQYINHIGKKLAHFAKVRTSYFFIVKSSEINAFAGPGGYIGFNSQLILATSSESELAAVMAHELAHVRLHHLYNMIEHEKKMRIPMLASLLVSMALGVVNPTLGSGAMMASMSGFAENNINFTRAREKEADRIGIDMLIRAGFNPLAMAGFFKKMQEASRYYYTANIPAILRTHPLDSDRIAEADNRSLHLPVKKYTNSLDYLLFKELVRTATAQDHKHLLDYYQHHCHPKVACRFGLAITLTEMNRAKEAIPILNQLLAEDSNNLFFQISAAQAETAERQYAAAAARFEKLGNNFPENYAVLMAQAQSLLAAGNSDKAVSILLKGRRQFKTDLPLCEALARAQSQAKLKAFAYFTESQCLLLQGRQRDAMRQLKLVKKMSTKDPYLSARAKAMMDEITYMKEDI